MVQSSDESLDMKAKGGEGGRGQWTVGSLEALGKSKVEPESPDQAAKLRSQFATHQHRDLGKVLGLFLKKLIYLLID